MAHEPLAGTFYFDSFLYDPKGEIRFEYSTDAGHRFTHVLTHSFPPDSKLEALAPSLFALGMAEIPGYWKALLAPKIVVRAGALSPEQVVFWEDLYLKGLGEFFYVNTIDFRGVLSVRSDPTAPTISPSVELASGILVPLGGGKDSLVTAERLKHQGKQFSWFELEPLPGNEKLREIADVVDTVQIGRDVQKNFAPVVDLVRRGAPNGHVPITATYIFSAVLAGEAYGYRDIIPSLERSAEFGNVTYLGTTINHQYSKSFAFEQAVHTYVQQFVNPNMRVFSLLRPYYEIQIVEQFASYPQYFEAFISCNRGLKTNMWCGECAKCAFMFAALSAFLPPERVESIFKKNLFADPALIPLYTDLVGRGAMKPFDCVGTFEENLLALYLSGERYKNSGRELPVVLSTLPIADGARCVSLLTEVGPSHIPPEYA